MIYSIRLAKVYYEIELIEINQQWVGAAKSMAPIGPIRSGADHRAGATPTIPNAEINQVWPPLHIYNARKG